MASPAVENKIKTKANSTKTTTNIDAPLALDSKKTEKPWEEPVETRPAVSNSIDAKKEVQDVNVTFK